MESKDSLRNLKTPEILDGDILRIRSLNLTAKRVISLMRHCQDDQHKVGLSQSWIAQRLSVSRQAVGRAIQQLIELNLIQPYFRQQKQTSVFKVLGEQTPKKFFLFFTHNNDCGQIASLLYSYLDYRQGGNDNAWPHIQTICDDLGLSKSTVLRAIEALEKGGYIEVDHANGGLKQGNRYRLTDKIFVVRFETPEVKSGVSKCNTIDNTYKELKKEINGISPAERVYQENSSPKTPQHTESEVEYTEKVKLLTQNFVNLDVARSLARVHTLSEIKAAVLNAVGQCQARKTNDPRLARFIKIAGYIVATLNTARQEGHTVKKNSFIRWHEAKMAAEAAAKKAQPAKADLSDTLKAERLKALAAEQIRQFKAVLALEAQFKTGVA